MKLIFYDFEVLKNDWLVSFYKEDTNQWYTFRNNRDGLCGFVLQHKSNYYFVGFNNKPFDDQCLKAIWYNINPYRVIEHSIIDNKPFWTLPEFQYKRNIPNFVSIDLTKLPKMRGSNGKLVISLKEIEGNLGMAIVESDLLDKDHLNEEEYKQVLEYNKHDVLATYEFYKQVKEQIECKEELINEFKLPKSCFSKTYVDIAKEIFKPRPIKLEESFIYNKPSCINLEHKDIENIYNGVEFKLDTNVKVEKQINGLNITFGLGGAHGVIKNFYYKWNQDEVVIVFDIEGMYPNILQNDKNKEFCFLTRTINDSNAYKQIKVKRIEYKHNGNKKKSDAYKVIVNGQYGASLQFFTNNTPGPFCDWINGRKTCFTGQLAITMLLETCNKINGFKAFNLNTDGIYAILPKSKLDEIKTTLSKLEDKLGFSLETKILNKCNVIQKDVNNYIIYDEETKFEKHTGGNTIQWLGGSYRRNTLSIVDEALVKYFLFNKPINETLQEAYDKNEVIKFQMIYIPKTHTYDAVKYGEKEVQWTNRVFASLDKNLPNLYKTKNNRPNNFPLCPQHCFLYNGDLKNINLKDINLDLTYYFNIINKKIEQWKGVKNV